DISRTRRNIKEISILKAYSIKRVNLRDINIDSELLYKLFYQIKGVEYLDISDNYYIKHLDLSHLDNLKYLNIKNCISLEKIILSKKIKNKINIEGSIKNKNILYN
ncbi:MAG: hypothetical protein N2446_02415, partial [Elusimicrobiales bacterium]|nr:hypothetical protein [Elusimicrobiales bacterium]